MKISEGLKKLHEYIVHVLVQISHAAAVRPKLVFLLVPVLSLSIFFIGINTNFYMETDEVSLWTPLSSRSIEHGNWLRDESGLTFDGAQLQILIHKNGENVLGKEGLDYVFKAVNVVKSMRSFNASCSSIMGVGNFFDNDYDLFQRTVLNDIDAIQAISTLPFFPNGDIVNRKEIYGYSIAKLDGMLRSAKSYMIKFNLPASNSTNEFEMDAVEVLLDLRREWSLHTSSYRLEILSSTSYSNEFQESVQQDVKLLPFVFVIMTTFSALVFYRRDVVQSSSLCLGIGAVVTVVLSILTSFGLLFTIGVPFTNLAFMVPFIIFGIGLDDSYIIMGSYDRVVGSTDVVDRIALSMKDCGLSIFVTTLTTSSAFSLSLISDIPAVRDFSIYASVSVAIDFLYQVTFFIALIIINDERIQCSRFDLTPCLIRRNNESSVSEEVAGSTAMNVKIMSWYAKKLIHLATPHKVVIIVGFFALSTFNLVSSLKLKVSFDFTDMVPPKSYVKSYTHALQKYYQSEPYNCLVVFRGVDFADSKIQNAMKYYIDDLVNLDFISNSEPQSFWLHDFQDFVLEKELMSLDFDAQLNAFLGVDWYLKLYSPMIGFSSDGDMVSSSVMLSLNIPLSDTNEQVQFLTSQEEVTKAQPINKDADEWNFFTFSPTYFMWEFFRETTHEFIMNTMIGMGAVFFTTLVFVQHPAGCLFVTLTVALIYVDVLGIAQVLGMSINPATYVSIILSIGLMVDYVVHVMLKYFDSDAQSKQGKVFDCLSTMGSSIIIGGMSTILGTIPLAFSSSEIFHSVLIIFISFVTLSLAHGLLFLPIVLMTISLNATNNVPQTQQADRPTS